MNRHVNAIASRLSLRAPQRQSLEILDRVTELVPTGNDWHDDGWHDWMPMHRCDLPDYVPDVRAGCSAPVALTEWKIKAIKLAIILSERPVTRADFAALKISPSRWTDPWTGYLIKGDGGYVPGPRMPDFRAIHPVNYAQIEADRSKWLQIEGSKK